VAEAAALTITTASNPPFYYDIKHTKELGKTQFYPVGLTVPSHFRYLILPGVNNYICRLSNPVFDATASFKAVAVAVAGARLVLHHAAGEGFREKASGNHRKRTSRC
jgi:hypothetical protein